MTRLPEKIRSVLEKLVRELSHRETISGVGLFGSWSRGDAVLSSDVDLLIVDKQNHPCEFVERLELGDILIDLNYVPRKWVVGPFPPEIDQKLFELSVLYDQDWSLTSAKDWMVKAFRRPERLKIRSEVYLVDSDIYLSRASSALARGDLQSSVLFAGVGLESLLKMLIEIGLLPVSNSNFVRNLYESCRKLGCPRVFESFLAVSRLEGAGYQDAEKRLGLFRMVWDDVTSFMREHFSALDSLHFGVKSRLNYYGNLKLLRGITARGRAIIDSGAYNEACHYVLRTLVDFLESYAWLASTVEGMRLDYTRLFRSLRGLKETPPRIYENAVDAFNVRNITRKEAEEVLKIAKETVLSIRRQRKELIQRPVKAA